MTAPFRLRRRRSRPPYNPNALRETFTRQAQEVQDHDALTGLYLSLLREALQAPYGLVFRRAAKDHLDVVPVFDWELLGISGELPPVTSDEPLISREFPGALRLPFTYKDETVGMTIFGPKPSGGGYSKPDRDLIISLTQLMSLRMHLFDYMGKEREKSREVEVLREAIRMQEQFLNIVSHELRTPVSIILAAISFLKHEGDAVSHALFEVYHGRIYRNAEHLTLLVNDLLNAGQLQSGTFVLHPQPCSLPRLIQEAVEDLAPLAHAKRQTLSFEGLSIPLDLEGDAQRLAQVVRNLIFNAIRHNPEEIAITVTARSFPQGIRCEVRDDGVGLAAEHLPMLFERFAQLKPQGPSADRGIGLGLFIARAIVEAHGGTIGVESAPGIGSTFWFEIPMATSPPLETPLPARD